MFSVAYCCKQKVNITENNLHKASIRIPNMWQEVQISLGCSFLNLLYFLPPKSKCSQCPISQHPWSMFHPQCDRQVFTNIRSNRKTEVHFAYFKFNDFRKQTILKTFQHDMNYTSVSLHLLLRHHAYQQYSFRVFMVFKISPNYLTQTRN